MRCRMLCVVVTAVMMMGMVIPAEAAQKSGELRVTLDFGDGEVHDGSVIFCQVAQPDGEHYRLKDSFGGGLVKREDAVSDALACWLAEIVPAEGNTRILDADGTAWFTNLSEGLYLLVQNEQIENMDPFEPILITMPSSGQWQLVAHPQMRMILSQSPQTGHPFAPVLGAMVLVVSGLGLVVCFERIRRK